MTGSPGGRLPQEPAQRALRRPVERSTSLVLVMEPGALLCNLMGAHLTPGELSGTMGNDETRTIGRRVREVRLWRQMSLKAVADLAGISEGYLSRIERGERGVHRRSLLDSLAAALRVSPTELAEQAFPPAVSDPVTAETQAAVIVLEAALSDLELGEPATEARPYPAVAADMDRLNTKLRPAADYAAQALLLPGLLAELHTLYATDSEHRTEILRALVDCYHTTAILLKNLGVRGLPTLAAFRLRRIAEELNDPVWLGLGAVMK